MSLSVNSARAIFGRVERIAKIEMLSTSFYTKTPIRKIDTDEILNLIENHFLTVVAA